MSHTTAQSWCSSQNGHLPIPGSFEENEFLRQLGSTWLGFDTSNLDILNWTNWGYGEPSGDGSKVRLVDISPSNSDKWYGQWNADDDDVEFPATCYITSDGTGKCHALTNFDMYQIL